MNFHESLELLKEATPENIAQQLLGLNMAIQSADSQQIMAIFFTLDALSDSASPSSTAWKQIYKLKASVESRMVFLVSSVNLPGEKRARYEGFRSAIGYSANLDATMKQLN